MGKSKDRGLVHQGSVNAISKIISLLSKASVDQFVDLTYWGKKLTTALAKALESALFRDIRRRQPHNPNHLRPCMIIDNPRVMREVIAANHPYFTHPGAEEIYTFRSKYMDRYAERYGDLADRVWREEYLNGKDADRVKSAM